MQTGKTVTCGVVMRVTDTKETDRILTVLTADTKRLYSFTLEEGALTALDHAGEAFITTQLERSFRTLDYYKSLLG